MPRRAPTWPRQAAVTESESQYNRSRELMATQALSKSQLRPARGHAQGQSRALGGRAGAARRHRHPRAVLRPRRLATRQRGHAHQPRRRDHHAGRHQRHQARFLRAGNFLSHRCAKVWRCAPPRRRSRAAPSPARSRSIDSRVDMNTRSVTVRALLANEDGALKPGMFLNVSLANDEREALFIPEQALTPEAEQQFVFVVADGKARASRSAHRRAPPGQCRSSRRPDGRRTGHRRRHAEGARWRARTRHRPRSPSSAPRCRRLARGQHVTRQPAPMSGTRAMYDLPTCRCAARSSRR